MRLDQGKWVWNRTPGGIPHHFVRLDELNGQMNALKCVLNSLEGFVQQVEKAKDPDETLRSICISDIQKNKAKSTKLTGFKERLWHQVKRHGQGMHQELQSVAHNHAVIQQHVSDVVCFLGEHHQKMGK